MSAPLRMGDKTNTDSCKRIACAITHRSVDFLWEPGKLCIAETVEYQLSLHSVTE